VTRGARLACFFWIQSMIRDAGRRALLYDMDRSIQGLHGYLGESRGNPELLTLTGCYHNLLRQWAEL